MTRIDRYLIRHIFAMAGLVALVLVSIYTFVIFVSELGQLDHKGFGVWGLVEYALLQVPSNAYLLLPMIVLLGTLLGLGNLAQQNELTAIRCAGVSWGRVGTATLVAGVVLGGCGFLLGNWLGPLAQGAADTLTGHRSSAHDYWLRDAADVVRIGTLRSADQAADVTIYQLTPEHRIASTLTAASAHYADGSWQLHDVQRSVLGANGVQVETLPVMQWHSGVTPKVLKLFVLKQDSLSAPGLLRLVHYLRSNHLAAEKYEMLLWRKLVEPLSIIAMMLLAVPFAAGHRLRQSGIGQRLLAGILIGVVFYVLDEVAVNLGEVYDWSPLLSAVTPTALFAAVAVWRLQRLQ
ncbi:MAG TPA: LPS export ABC transporter permease LptG [Nevskiaceae bacterium]|nr:LPS export ABC transporter permease LptG [Nevskiaceae bacterium]